MRESRGSDQFVETLSEIVESGGHFVDEILLVTDDRGLNDAAQNA